MESIDERGRRRLAALERRVARSLARLGEPARSWVAETPGLDADVAIVGAGQSGLATAFALRRAGIHRIAVLDAAPAGGEGPWATTARMLTLRSPKEATGPELGIAELAYRAWHEAAFGAASHRRLGKIPNGHWMAYLDWYRRATAAPVENGVRLLGFAPAGDGLRLSLERQGRPESRAVRRLVLATGMEGAGGPAVPPLVAERLPKRLWAHTGEAIDLAALAGRRLAVLGAASSAFDAAAAALEAGAARVDLFCRRPALPTVNRLKALSDAGTFAHFGDLPDDVRWRVMRRLLERAPPPTAETVARAVRLPGFRLHLDSPWTALSVEGEAVRIATQQGRFAADFVILGTGYAVDPTLRPELAPHAGRIALWRDRYTPPRALADDALARFPYLGPGFELTETAAGAAPWLSRVHLYGYGATLSHGRAAGEGASLRWGVPRLVSAIARSLLVADADAHARRLVAFDEPDIGPADWQPALATPAGARPYSPPSAKPPGTGER